MRSSCSQAFPLRKTLLALTVGAITHSAAAVENDAGERQKNEETMVVQATPDSRFRAGGDLVVPGEQNAMDVPFSIIGYTSKLIQDQQAKTITDVVSNDAGVQPVQGYGNYAETYRIRGLKFDGDDMTLSGLAGVVPRQVVDTAMLERVEIFKGA
ncbi:TonB-dependent receptor plug domain-containing protein, partial [Klebsiella pneumoniae]|uniref:TonB-dependent receptor plug domain-containing protein n=1 Tax=Klebsiella pneumoniae TaxID=573 RepID=UPI0015F340B7